MCGFAGEFCFGPPADPGIARSMADRLAHRGPDETGEFLSPDGQCAIGFRRLRVIDPAGSHQPLTDVQNRATIAFNGEIYNYRRLRDDLEKNGRTFKSHGDAEVLVNLYLLHGTAMFDMLEGMFAFAIYDHRAERLLLARDRFGQKPLWLARLPDRVVFASEAKALFAHPGVSRQPSNDSLIEYINIGYINSPRSAWAGVEKLPPACYLDLSGPDGRPRTYWTLKPAAPPSDRDDALERIRRRLRGSVEQRMIADVPLGALLSGGIDSAVVVALMNDSAGAAGGVRTFTAGFAEEAAYDERPLARLVADRFRTDHTELVIEPKPAEMLDWVVDRYDEPFADSSAYPTSLICRAARAEVTVALCGDGGDEVFGGYDRYRAMHLAETMKPWEYLLFRTAGRLASLVGPVHERSRLRRLARFAGALDESPPMQYYRYRCLFRPEDLGRLLQPDFLDSVEVERPIEEFCELFEQGDIDGEARRAQRHDLLSYLPGDLLVKADIASMASSLELRAPMLDPDLVSLGLALPAEWKYSRRRGKVLLRQAFADILPPGILDQPKRGFGVPLGRWLRGPLREIMREILTDPAFANLGIFQPRALHGLMNDHLAGRDDHSHRLWALMVLARWLVRQG